MHIYQHILVLISFLVIASRIKHVCSIHTSLINHNITSAKLPWFLVAVLQSKATGQTVTNYINRKRILFEDCAIDEILHSLAENGCITASSVKDDAVRIRNCISRKTASLRKSVGLPENDRAVEKDNVCPKYQLGQTQKQWCKKPSGTFKPWRERVQETKFDNLLSFLDVVFLYLAIMVGVMMFLLQVALTFISVVRRVDDVMRRAASSVIQTLYKVQSAEEAATEETADNCIVESLETTAVTAFSVGQSPDMMTSNWSAVSPNNTDSDTCTVSAELYRGEGSRVESTSFGQDEREAGCVSSPPSANPSRSSNFEQKHNSKPENMNQEVVIPRKSILPVVMLNEIPNNNISEKNENIEEHLFGSNIGKLCSDLQNPITKQKQTQRDEIINSVQHEIPISTISEKNQNKFGLNKEKLSGDSQTSNIEPEQGEIINSEKQRKNPNNTISEKNQNKEENVFGSDKDKPFGDLETSTVKHQHSEVMTTVVQHDTGAVASHIRSIPTATHKPLNNKTRVKNEGILREDDESHECAHGEDATIEQIQLKRKVKFLDYPLNIFDQGSITEDNVSDQITPSNIVTKHGLYENGIYLYNYQTSSDSPVVVSEMTSSSKRNIFTSAELNVILAKVQAKKQWMESKFETEYQDFLIGNTTSSLQIIDKSTSSVADWWNQLNDMDSTRLSDDSPTPTTSHNSKLLDKTFFGKGDDTASTSTVNHSITAARPIGVQHNDVTTSAANQNITTAKPLGSQQNSKPQKNDIAKNSNNKTNFKTPKKEIHVVNTDTIYNKKHHFDKANVAASVQQIRIPQPKTIGNSQPRTSPRKYRRKPQQGSDLRYMVLKNNLEKMSKAELQTTIKYLGIAKIDHVEEMQREILKINRDVKDIKSQLLELQQHRDRRALKNTFPEPINDPGRHRSVDTSKVDPEMPEKQGLVKAEKIKNLTKQFDRNILQLQKLSGKKISNIPRLSVIYVQRAGRGCAANITKNKSPEITRNILTQSQLENGIGSKVSVATKVQGRPDKPNLLQNDSAGHRVIPDSARHMVIPTKNICDDDCISTAVIKTDTRDDESDYKSVTTHETQDDNSVPSITIEMSGVTTRKRNDGDAKYLIPITTKQTKADTTALQKTLTEVQQNLKDIDMKLKNTKTGAVSCAETTKMTADSNDTNDKQTTHGSERAIINNLATSHNTLETTGFGLITNDISAVEFNHILDKMIADDTSSAQNIPPIDRKNPEIIDTQLDINNDLINDMISDVITQAYTEQYMEIGSLIGPPTAYDVVPSDGKTNDTIGIQITELDNDNKLRHDSSIDESRLPPASAVSWTDTWLQSQVSQSRDSDDDITTEPGDDANLDVELQESMSSEELQATIKDLGIAKVEHIEEIHMDISTINEDLATIKRQLKQMLREKYAEDNLVLAQQIATAGNIISGLGATDDSQHSKETCDMFPTWTHNASPCKNIEKVSKGLGPTGTHNESANKNIEKVSKGLDPHVTHNASANKNIEKVSKGLDPTGTHNASASKIIEKVSKRLDPTGAHNASASKNSEKVSKGLDSKGTHSSSSSKNIEKVSKGLDSTGTHNASASKHFEKVSKGLDSKGTHSSSASKNIEKVSEGIDQKVDKKKPGEKPGSKQKEAAEKLAGRPTQRSLRIQNGKTSNMPRFSVIAYPRRHSPIQKPTTLKTIKEEQSSLESDEPKRNFPNGSSNETPKLSLIPVYNKKLSQPKGSKKEPE